MISRRRSAAPLVSVLVALALAVGLAACGGSSSSTSSNSSTSGSSGNGVAAESPDAILQSAQKAADALKSVRVSGTVKDSGTTYDLDLHLEAGVGSKGTITLSGKQVQLVTIGKTVYLNGGAGFWRSYGGSAAAELLAGKWLKAPATGNFAGINDLGTITDLFNKTFASHGTLAKEGKTTVDGQAAVAIKDTTDGGTLYVATTGQPLPLVIVGSGHDAGDKLSFTEFNAPVTVTAPSGAIDLSELESGA